MAGPALDVRSRQLCIGRQCPLARKRKRRWRSSRRFSPEACRAGRWGRTRTAWHGSPPYYAQQRLGGVHVACMPVCAYWAGGQVGGRAGGWGCCSGCRLAVGKKGWWGCSRVGVRGQGQGQRRCWAAAYLPSQSAAEAAFASPAIGAGMCVATSVTMNLSTATPSFVKYLRSARGRTEGDRTLKRIPAPTSAPRLTGRAPRRQPARPLAWSWPLRRGPAPP